jgi:glycosyltransferase involved in cell wall biosynthesis
MITALAQLGVHAQRVPLGVDQQVWPRRLPSPRTVEEPASLLHVGSLNRVKDQSTLLRAFAMLVKSRPDLRLDVVGEDTLQGQMQAQAHEMRLRDRVTFHGFLTQPQLRPLMERSHLLIMSSRHEAGPIVMLEAAMVGVPTVGTTVGHIAEWAPDAALAAPVGDAAGLAALIDTLLTDEQRRLRIAAKAQHRALQEDADFTASRLEQIYATLGCS